MELNKELNKRIKWVDKQENIKTLGDKENYSKYMNNIPVSYFFLCITYYFLTVCFQFCNFVLLNKNINEIKKLEKDKIDYKLIK